MPIGTNNKIWQMGSKAHCAKKGKTQKTVDKSSASFARENARTDGDIAIANTAMMTTTNTTTTDCYDG